METPHSIRRFWFGAREDDAAVAAEQSALWWSKRVEVDHEIRRRFEETLDRAARRELDDWGATPHGCLALILLTDQFPRNMYRDTARAFAFDGLARAWCLDGLARGIDRALRPIERVFFYLPLEHSENPDDQARAVALFRALAAEAPPEAKATFDGFVDFSLRHQAVIDRFGRFPHRNRLLGQASSAEEAAFLSEPGSSF